MAVESGGREGAREQHTKRETKRYMNIIKWKWREGVCGRKDETD